jgi:hypothetical protein
MSDGRHLPTPLPDAPGPASLPDPDRIRAILDAADQLTPVGRLT